MLLLFAVAASVRVPATDAHVVVVGRRETAGDAVVLSWSAGALRARFTGTSLSLEVEERPAPPEPIEHPRPGERAQAGTDCFAAFVDGARSELSMPRGAGAVVVARGLKPGVHTLSLVKRTEPLVGTTVVKALVLDDGAALVAPGPLGPKRRRVEVIGDSLAAGFGVLGKGPDCPFSADTEDATRAFPALVARRFRADLAVVAWSGRGVYRDFDGRTDVESVPALYAKTPPLSSRANVDDVVVVELGNNDFLEGVPDRGRFMAAMHALLDEIRRRSPRAFILLLSPMPLSKSPKDPVATVAPTWMNAVVHKRGDGRLAWAKLPARDDALGLGCVWHPGPRMQQRLADTVAAALTRHLRW